MRCMEPLKLAFRPVLSILITPQRCRLDMECAQTLQCIGLRRMYYQLHRYSICRRHNLTSHIGNDQAYPVSPSKSSHQFHNRRNPAKNIRDGRKTADIVGYHNLHPKSMQPAGIPASCFSTHARRSVKLFKRRDMPPRKGSLNDQLECIFHLSI